MATYDLVCDNCGEQILEYKKKMADEFPMCTQCGETMRTQIKSVPIVNYNAPGFYTTSKPHRVNDFGE